VVFVVFFLEFGRLHYLGAKAGNERASPEDTFLKLVNASKKKSISEAHTVIKS
jgi:hypothetical protein